MVMNRIWYSRLQQSTMLAAVCIAGILTGCRHSGGDSVTDPVASVQDKYTITQTISDEAQRNTLAFDGLAFLTGTVGSQSFLPPGKVADYSGFQYLRDNDPTDMGHNTAFVTIIAYNVLHILTPAQVAMFVERAGDQISAINTFAYQRFPVLQAFRRLVQNDLPAGASQLNKEALLQYMAGLYKLDGQISLDRARLFGKVIASLSSDQIAQLNALKAKHGIGNWDATLSDPLAALSLPQDVSVAVMTYASEMYAWYAGSVTDDVYFCPERQGTYFGSFYLKDWPAMGNPNYTINEQLTASAGQDFISVLNPSQAALVTGLVDVQRSALTELVARRESIALELRKYLSAQSADSSTVMALSARYGELDGEISYHYATTFSAIYQGMTDAQKTKLSALAANLGSTAPPGAFLYSQPIAMPAITNTDYLFQ